MRSIQSHALPLLQMLWRHRWLAVVTAWLVCTGGWVAVALMPTKYESSARVYLNADPLLTPLLRGLAADTNPARHLDFMRRTLTSRPNLEQLIHLVDFHITNDRQKEAVFRELVSDVYVGQITENLLTISYRSTNPMLAKDVVQGLLTIFAENTAGHSRSEMDSAQRFLDEEIASYQDKLRAAERRRAELIRQYPDILPVSDASEGRVHAAKEAVKQLRRELTEALAKRDELKRQLAGVPPVLTFEKAPQVIVTGQGHPTTIKGRLQEARNQLDILRLKYTDDFPDVILTKAEVKQLEAELEKAEKTPSQPGSDESGKTEIANSLYEQLKVRLADADGTIASLKFRLSDAEAEQSRIEKIVRSAPTISAQAMDLDRDYGILKRSYEELVARREAARIADAADTKTNKIEFRIVDPPQVPVLPTAPNRPLLVSAVLLAGLGAGLAVPIAMMQLDHSFATIAQLRDLGIPIIGSVSRLAIGAARRRVTVQLAEVGASALVLFAVYGTLLALSISRHWMGVS
jgi:polysaccharide chain length determinant protein (PEP-CTERM system associated)